MWQYPFPMERQYNDLVRIIEWLLKIEHTACDIYSKAAHYFSDNKKLHQFMEHAAEDEAWHYHVIASLAHHHRDFQMPPLSIAVDHDIARRIELLFFRISEMIADGSLMEKDVLELIADAEFSEWNDIFIYVVSHLKDHVKEFKYAVARIHRHRKYIEHFLEQNRYGKEILVKLADLPEIWREGILIVDDDVIVAELIKAVLHGDGTVDIAPDGAKALEKLTQKYYSLIISDIEMPEMDGISFFQKAVDLFPSVRERFLFITGYASDEHLDFINKQRVSVMKKPVPIREIRRNAMKILLK